MTHSESPLPHPPFLDRLLKKIFRITPFVSYGRKESILRFLGRTQGNGFLFSHRIRNAMLTNLDSSYWIEQKLFYYGSYESHILRLSKELVERINHEFGVDEGSWEFWDVGANIGLYSFELAASIPKVFAFEPVPSLADDLERVVSSYDLSNVHVCRFGLASFDGCLPMKLPAGINKGCGSFSLASGVGDPILPLRRADSEMENRHKHIKLVKVDVEGFEIEVLRGMQKLLEIHKPVLIIEYSPSLNNSMKLTIDPLLGLLPGGYRLLQIFYDGYSDKYRLEAISGDHVLSDTVELVAFPGWLDGPNGTHLS